VEWIVIGLIVVGLLLWRRNSQLRAGGGPRQLDRAGQRPERRLSAEELAGVRRAADEDVTQFGEELQGLDTDLAGHDLDEGTRQDYQRALDAYEDAKTSVAAVQQADDVQHVTEILGDGRYAVACVRARVAGGPLPPRRPPCFFNPQHGPSVRDVEWTPEGGSVRQVPACALDAERVEAGAEPASRQVMVGSRRMPYWQAGPAFAPFGAGYFGGFGLMEGLFVGTLLGSSMGFGGDGSFDSGYADGYQDGQDSGDGGDGGGDGGDSGGGDYGGGDGGDFGGGDFGGGDFGGGDFGGGDF
jgi:hypothetical protein